MRHTKAKTKTTRMMCGRGPPVTLSPPELRSKQRNKRRTLLHQQICRAKYSSRSLRTTCLPCVYPRWNVKTEEFKGGNVHFVHFPLLLLHGTGLMLLGWMFRSIWVQKT